MGKYLRVIKTKYHTETKDGCFLRLLTEDAGGLCRWIVGNSSPDLI